MDLSISDFMTHLVSGKNFYARVANGLQRVPVEGLGTMAVGIRGGRASLYYDPAFIARCSMAFGVFVLEHEMMHIVLDHLPRYFEFLATASEEQKAKAKVVFNLAMDCAVNTNLRNDPSFNLAKRESKYMIKLRNPEHKVDESDDAVGIVLPENYTLDLDGSFDYYQVELMRKVRMLPPEFMAQLMQDLEDLVGDSHKEWNDPKDDGDGRGGGGKSVLPEELQGLAHQLRTQLKEVLRKAVQDHVKSRGTVPGECAEWLEEYLSPSVVPWWDILTTRIKVSKQSRPERGVSRPNRMLLAMAEEDASIIPAIGKMRDPKFRVFFYVDTSGSMNTESLQIARNELAFMMATDEDMQIRYMQGDSKTHFDQVFKGGDELPKDVHGRGGTDFDEYFSYMSKYVGNDETSPDLVIVFTDGYAPSVQPEFQLPPDIPVIWLLTPSHSAEQLKNYGEIIVCSSDQNEMWKHQ